MDFFNAIFCRLSNIVAMSIFGTIYYRIIFVFVVTLNSYCFLYTITQSHSACIIVHGTWAKDETWHHPSGDFFKSVQSCNQELQLVDEVVSFGWSGKLGYPAQLQAAQDLAKNIELYDWVILIAHSHGATVGMIASQIIFKNSTSGNKVGKIDKFYALGVPIDETTIIPNMVVIKKFYNLFSFGDLIQTVNGIYQRIFSNHERIANISVQFCNNHPSHCQLHHPALGIYLLKIDEFFAEKKIGNFQNFAFHYPGCLQFDFYQTPIYGYQFDQPVLLKADQCRQKLTQAAFFRGGKKF